jgi:enamine deaminase RidA (YjgF/YER057c/UK114 family)
VTDTIDQRLEELGLELPQPVKPTGNYKSVVTSGALAFVSGHGPFSGGEPAFVGRLVSTMSIEDGYLAARLAILNCLSSLREELGTLARVTQVVKLLGMVNSDHDFTQQPEVVNGASDVLTELFGNSGRHARSSVGMGALPLGIPVEIEMIVEFSAGR